jgi:hypothetical protein
VVATDHHDAASADAGDDDQDLEPYDDDGMDGDTELEPELTDISILSITSKASGSRSASAMSFDCK